MERRIRDATRLMSTDGTNDSNAKDDVSIGAGFLLLPPANEVWGKVIFSQVSVCPQRGLCMMSLPVWSLWGGGLCPGCLPTENPLPPDYEKRAVRILLECFFCFIFIVL